MKVTPVSHPAQIQQTAPTDARAKAIAAFKQAPTPNAPTQPPVLNQNAVSVEELGAIQAPAKEEEQPLEITADSTDTSTVTEVTPEEPKKPEVDPAISKLYAQLARQEKAMRLKAQQQEQALQVREQALSTKETAIKSQETQYQQGYISLDQLKSNTMDILSQAGIDETALYEEMVQRQLNPVRQDPRVQATISRLEAKIAELESKTETAAKTYQEAQEASYKTAVKQIETDVKKMVYTDPAYEAIKVTNSVNDVVELIERTYKEEGILLSNEEAAQQVEEYLTEELTSRASQISKIKQRLTQGSASQAQANKQSQAVASPKEPQSPKTMTTLTNATASTRKLSAKERAILAFRGESKS